MDIVAMICELTPKAVQTRILERLFGVEATLERMESTMASLVEVANEVKDAVNARIDREIARGQEALAAKQAQLDLLIAAEDAEDVTQNAEIAALKVEVAGQVEAVKVLESIKSGVNADLNGDGGMVVPDQPAPDPEPVVEPEPVEPTPEPEPEVEVPVEEVVEPPVEEVDDETVVQL